MPLGGFGFISIFYAFLGVRFALQFWPLRKEIFDNTFTDRDRAMVTQASFFFLLPISVALHELGHAIAIWLFGGEVIGFEFYFFAGLVEFDPTGLSDIQLILIAFAGTLVNILLIALAMGVVFFKNPALRAPWNELLLQFSAISGLNALIIYPVLDLATGMSGDWTQMYEGDVPWLTALIVAIQAGVIGIGVWITRNPRARAKLAERTGVKNAADRNLLGWGGGPAQRQQSAAQPQDLNDLEKRFSSAASRVASGWNTPLTGKITRHPQGSALSLQWDDNGQTHVVVLQSDASDRVVISGGTVSAGGNGHIPPRARASWTTAPSENDLTFALRVAMEEIDREAAQLTP